MSETFKKSLNDEEKNIYLKALSYVLNCNDEVTEKCDFILKRAKEINFPTKNLRTIKKISRPETISNELLKVKDVRLRRYFMREMVMLAVSDHELADSEMCDLYKIATSVGIKEEKINDFFLWAAQGVEWQIEGTRLVEDDL